MDVEVIPLRYNSLKDVTWSTTSLPLDRLVNVYRLPQIVKLDSGESMEGLRENDYLLIHSSRQWTTITAHSLEEGHYVIGPKIEIPVHYEGQFKLLEKDRGTNEPVQYFNSVEDVAKAFPERVYVMEEITFSVKVASGECNEDTEVYNITLSTGDELTLMGQAEILYAKTAKEKSRLNTLLKKIGKLNSVSKLGHGKMPCLICMNHRTNESISLPFECKGRFSTRSPLELQMQEGEHTIRNIVEKTRLPVSVTVSSTPPRNQHDHHFIREGHHYKLVNIQTKTVVVCCVLRSNKVIPIHFPLHLAMPKFILPEGLLQNELWLETTVRCWFSFCQEQFDIDDYSRAVRDVRADWNEDGKSPKKTVRNGSSSINCLLHSHVPTSLTYARDELTQSFHRLSVCVYGNNLHGNNEVNLQGYNTLCGDWALIPPDSSLVCDSIGSDFLFPELAEDPDQPVLLKSDLQYEELWLEKDMHQLPTQTTASTMENNKYEGDGGSINYTEITATLHYPAPGLSGSNRISEICLPPPPVPPKSDAVKEECRLLNAPPVPPRSSKPISSSPSYSITCQHRQQQTRSPSPTLSYYSSQLHKVRVTENETTDEQTQVCFSWKRKDPDATSSNFQSSTFDSILSRSSWPNDFCGSDSRDMDLLPVQCRSYYSYPRQKTPGAPVGHTSKPLNFDARERNIMSSAHYSAESNTKQYLSYPVLPPRPFKLNEGKMGEETTLFTVAVDGLEQEPQNCSVAQQPLRVNSKNIKDILSIPCPISSPPYHHLAPPWQPPANLSELSIEEVSKCLRFIGLSEDIVSLFAVEKTDGSLLLQLTEEILIEDFRLSKLQVKKVMQFMNGWRPKI